MERYSLKRTTVFWNISKDNASSNAFNNIKEEQNNEAYFRLTVTFITGLELKMMTNTLNTL